MNKRIRSRVLAASIVSTTLLGTGGLLYPERPVRAQDRPSAVEQLNRGARLFEQQQYGEAKRILTDLDPAQLPENQRARHTDLLTRTDMALAQAMGPNARFDSAEQDLAREQFASAAGKYQSIIDDAQAPAEVKERARVQLALVRQSQANRAPQMRELLNQAQALYDQGKLDEAQNALNTVAAVGAPLNWEDTPRLQRLQASIAERRTAIARGETTPPPVPPTPGAAGGGGNVLDVAPGTQAPPVVVQGGNPLDVAPGAQGTGGQMVEPAPGGGGLLEQYRGVEEVRRQRAMALYHEARRLSQEAMQQNPPQFQQAIDRANEAIDVINANRAVLSEIEADALRDAAQSQLALATTREADWRIQQQRELEEQTRVLDAQRARSVAEAKRRQVSMLIADANRLVQVSQFTQAADLLQQATVIDPLNEEAKLMYRLVEDKINARLYEALKHRQGVETIKQTIDSAEHMIPYADLMVYPDNWVEITRKRQGSEAGQDSPANRTVRARLEEPLREITAEQQGLERVLNFLRDSTNSNIFVNWRALEAAGIDRNSPVTISLKEIPFRKALQTILAEVGGGTANLGYTIDDGIITVSTRDDLDSVKYQTVKVFDVRDLLVQPNNRAAPTLNLGQTTQQAGQGGGGFGGGQGGQQGGQGGLFGDTNNQNNQNQNQNLQANRQTIVTSITDTIKAVVAPDSWRDNGGTIGSIRELNGQLIVNQTVDNQIEVMNLLQQLRETRAIQIAIEARLLLVSNNFLDDFRIGWNLTFPAGSIANNLGAVNFNNLNSYSNAIPPDTGVPGSIVPLAQTPAFNFAATIIDNWTLNLLLTATQADKRTVSVAAPRVTIFNGQTGFIAVTNQLNFVSNFNQTVAAGGTVGTAATATSLTIGTLTTGVTLQVEATVSSDHRYVVMNVDPQLSTLDGIDTISTGTTGSNTTGGSNSLAAVGGAFVQLPRISNTEVNTMVSVPDEGTLLIGGQKLVGESEIEIGVPVLSKIPGLNRFFTNRAFVKDERTLLVMVRPKIIIHKEIENDLFGPGYDRPTGLPTSSGAAAVPAVLPGGM